MILGPSMNFRENKGLSIQARLRKLNSVESLICLYMFVYILR